jgi:hypothetical protein
MTDRLAVTSVGTSRSPARNYEWIELEYLFERVGAPSITGSFTGLGNDSLPDFFQELVTGMIEYDFVWGTQLVKDLKSLAFGGEDAAVSYANRFRGLSIFSLAPISESNVADAVTLRQTIIQFESTEDNHGPAEASAMAKLAATWNSVPGTRHEALAWVEHVWMMTLMMFGDACEANQYLKRLRYNTGANPVTITQLDLYDRSSTLPSVNTLRVDCRRRFERTRRHGVQRCQAAIRARRHRAVFGCTTVAVASSRRPLAP